jgi:ABC-type sugar transport system substrate-binding protein
LALALVVCMLAACSGGGSGSGGSEPVDTGSSAPVETDTGASADAAGGFVIEKVPDVKIAWVAPLVNDYFEVIADGAQDFADEYGAELNLVYGTDASQEESAQKIEALMAQGYRNYLIYPIDSAASNTLYEEITAAGAKVVNYGMNVDTPTTASLFAGHSAYDTTIYQLEKMNEILGDDGGQVMILMEQMESPYMRVAKVATDDYVKDHPNFVVAQTIGDIATTEEAVTKISDAFSANIGNIDGIVSIGTVTTIGLARILNEFYATNPDQEHIPAVVLDCDAESAAAIKSGYIDIAIYEPKYDMGYLSAAMSYLLATGYEPAGDYFVYLDNIDVTQENADTYASDEQARAKAYIAENFGDILKKS